ncbi:transglycosylase domain-containing protein [Cellulomonas sp.]|uniref:transglycosylase domain-containing protein n=1 Tax=Cellulomonas sp. TaxID=40001 RepID=UPI0025900362|nr:transglycosylase domain-containing protein [Cellulomonas sp.]MCR6688573.1 transglycosylase domain-containing protein [Cellulomonas sp.]
MAGSTRASASRSRRSAPRGTRGRSTAKRRFWDYPRSGYHGLHRWLPSWRFLLGSFLGFGFLLAGAVVAAYATIELPDPSEDISAQTTTVYYADGDVMGTYAVQKRELVDFADLPKYVGNAVVAAEDRTFWSNSGISVTGMARAFINNVRGGQKQGGSTLTQQYVERYYVNSTTTDYLGKAKEALLALKVNKQQEKPEILGNYLNTIYFGRDTYGIQAASQAYFGHDAKDMTVSEAAMIAAIIPAPNAWDPAVAPDKAEARWKIVVDRMLEDGWITQAQHDEAAFPTTVKYVRSTKYEGPQGHLLKMVEDEMASADRGINVSKEKLDRGGFKVYTTIQKPVQDELDSAVAELLKGELTDGEKPSKNMKVAVSSVDPATGGIVALYGGPDFLEDQVNRATYGDGVQAGSTFKPFTLVAALQQGIGLDTTYKGYSPMDVDGWDTSGGDDQVTNFDGESFGTIDLVDATAKSVNTVYAQLNLEVGAKETARVATEAGVTTPVDEYPSNVLGSTSVHPLDMANAYATFAAQGVRHDAHIVEKVLNPDGSTFFETDGNPDRVFDADVMADATYAMTQVVERGSGEPFIKPIGVPIAGKTGTSTGNLSAWFVGYTPTIATSVALSQVGSDGSSQVTITPVGPSPYGGELTQVTGASIPANLWATYMTPVLAMDQFAKVREFPERANVGEDTKPTWTPKPTQSPTNEPTTDPTQDPTEPSEARVPGRLVGRTQADAVAALLAVGLEPVIVSQPSDEVPAGRVISIDPRAGTALPVGSPVTLVISSGPEAPPDPEPTQTPGPKPTKDPGTDPTGKPDGGDG